MFGTREHRHEKRPNPKLYDTQIIIDFKSLSIIFFQKLKHHISGPRVKRKYSLSTFQTKNQNRVCGQDKKKILSQNRLGRKHGIDDGSLLNSVPLTALGDHSDSVSASN